MIPKVAIKLLKPAVKCLGKLERNLTKVRTKFLPKGVKATTSSAVEFKPIMATEFNTLKEMAKFNKNAFGVKVFDIRDKELGKFLTEGMTNFYNKTGGQFNVPKNIIVCDLPNPNGFMLYNETKDVLAISKKHIDKFKEIAKENGETLEQVLKKWGRKKFDGTATSAYSKGLYQELFHEFGHKAHFDACKNYGNLGLDWSKAEFQDIAAKISKYSKNSPEEFVAETYTLLVQGKPLPKDVMQLYQKCGGPIINNNSGGGGGLQNIITDFMQQNGHSEVNFNELMAMAKAQKQLPNITLPQNQGLCVSLEQLNETYRRTPPIDLEVLKALEAPAIARQKIAIEV